MLPSNLLSVWKRKDTIQPRFAEASVNNIVVAQTLIDTYKQSVGKKKGALKKVGDIYKAKRVPVISGKVKLLASLYEELHQQKYLDEAAQVIGDVNRVLGRQRGIRIGEAQDRYGQYFHYLSK